MTTAVPALPVEKKFLLVGGHLPSGDFVPATQLARLYGLNRSECILTNSAAMLAGMVGAQITTKIILRPRIAGDYADALAYALNPQEVQK